MIDITSKSRHQVLIKIPWLASSLNAHSETTGKEVTNLSTPMNRRLASFAIVRFLVLYETFGRKKNLLSPSFASK
jgi:hypothetical protein